MYFKQRCTVQYLILYRAVGEAEGRNAKCPQYCDACFTGAYPTVLTDRDGEEEPDQLTMLNERLDSSGSQRKDIPSGDLPRIKQTAS